MFHKKFKIHCFIPIQNEKVYNYRIPTEKAILALVLL